MNRSYFEQLCRSAAKAVYVGDQTVLVCALGHSPLYVPAEDHSLSQWLILTGYWESWVTLAVMEHVKPGSYCLDLGANFGYYTLVLAKNAGRAGRVVAVEPLPRLTALLRRTIAANEFDSFVTVLEAAAWDADGEQLTITVPASMKLGGSSVLGRPGDHRQSILCTSVTVDTITRDWPRLDFVKMDCEGSEQHIWNGMQQAIRKFKPTILMEFTPGAYLDPSSFLAAIRQAGYRLAVVNSSGQIVPVTETEVLGGEDGFHMLWLEST